MTGVPLHLFLTGEIQVGKSTIVSSVVSRLGVPVSGFRTVSVFRDGGESDVFLIPASGSLSDCCSASLFARRVPGRRPEVREEVFVSCGVPLLSQCSGGLVLMDELGWMESSSRLFQEAVFQEAVFSVLDGPIPVLGVVRDQRLPFLDAVRDHPQVEVVVVTRENRDALRDRVFDLVRERVMAAGDRRG